MGNEMGPETVATLVLVAVLVAVLAVYILAIGFALRRLSFTLGTIVIGLRAIAQQTAPVGAVVGDLVRDVDVIEDALDGLIGAVVTVNKAPRRVAAPALAAPQPSRTRPPQAVAWKPEAGEPETTPETGDEWDEVVAARAPGDKVAARAPGDKAARAPGDKAARAPGDNVPAGAIVARQTAARGRRAQARSAGRGSRRTSRSAPGAGSMSDAVARAREKVDARSQP